MGRRHILRINSKKLLTSLLISAALSSTSFTVAAADNAPAVKKTTTATFKQENKRLNITSPEKFFGHQIGADKKLIHWDDLVKYYQKLSDESPRIKLVNMGKTTLGKPFLALYISSPENLKNLEKYRLMNAKLSDPRGVPKAEIDAAIKEGKAVIIQSMGLHSNEVAASQMAAELTYDMLSRTDEEMMRILDQTIAIMIPSFNPDGEIMITDWYNDTVNTKYEGLGLPYLYHHYIGHDTNRDAFMTNTVESQYLAKIMFRDFIPQAYVDHHQMGSYGARFYVPPYSNPTRPNADPLVWREMQWYGAHMAYRGEEKGQAGIVNAALYSGWGHFGFHWITPFHNISGMLTEAASARLATPLFIHPDQLRGGGRALPKYEEQTTFPNPWKGGWWRVRNIVEYQLNAAISTLDIAAKNRETVLHNAYLKASRQTQRGAEAKIKAYIIPARQHDPLTMHKMINVLIGQGIDVKRATEKFTHEARVYQKGSYIVTMAQPKTGLIRWLLGRTFYPDNSYTRRRNGKPISPYDMSTDNIAEYMGVTVRGAKSKVTTAMAPITQKFLLKGTVESSSTGYILSGSLNDSFTAVNMLWNKGVKLERTDSHHAGLRAGDFIIPKSVPVTLLNKITAQTGVSFTAAGKNIKSRPVKRQRIALYHRYSGGNIDEGWTRFLLEDYKFPYSKLLDKAVISGKLRKKYDVIILPNDSASRMMDMKRTQKYPKKYQSGFGKKGVKALEDFVKAGGTILALGASGELAIKHFKLPIKNVIEKTPTTEFWSPGSTLRMNFDTENSISYGMPEEGVGLFLSSSDVYQVNSSTINHRVTRPATYISRDILQSGWLIGESHIANKASVVTVGHGKGEVIMIGFRAKHRVQTHGTFKLVFNALVSRPMK